MTLTSSPIARSPMPATLGMPLHFLRTISRKGDKNKRLNKQQYQELYRMVEVAALVGLGLVLFSDEEDRESFRGRLKYYALRELSTIPQALSIGNILKFGVVQLNVF